MFLKIIKKIPFAIPMFAIIDMMVISITNIIEHVSLQKLLKQLISVQFNPETPFYFNYWIIYIIIAIMISIILAITKKTIVLETMLAITVNIIILIVVLGFIMGKM